MKYKSRPIAKALIELAKTLPESEHGALLDAALRMLEHTGLTREIRIFPRLVLQELKKQESLIFATLTTPEGSAGAHAKSIESLLHKALDMKVSLDEVAEPAAIGGARLSFGDERYDRSIRAALDQFASHVRASQPVLS